MQQPQRVVVRSGAGPPVRTTTTRVFERSEEVQETVLGAEAESLEEFDEESLEDLEYMDVVPDHVDVVLVVEDGLVQDVYTNGPLSVVLWDRDERTSDEAVSVMGVTSLDALDFEEDAPDCLRRLKVEL